MINKLFICILFLIFSTTSIVTNGQARGYLGKRFTVELNSNFGFAKVTFINQNYQDISPSTSNQARKINLYPELAFSYTIGKRIDIGFIHSRDIVGINLYHLDIISTNNNNYTPNLVQPSSFTSTYQFIPTNPNNKATSQTYQFYFRFYNKRNIAPVGFYHQIAFGINRLGIKDRVIGDLQDDVITYPIELDIKKFNSYKLSYFFGNKKVFKNGLYINSGLNLNFTEDFNLTKLFESSQGGQDPNSPRVNTNSYNYHYSYISNISDEFKRAQLIEIKLGLGFIF